MISFKKIILAFYTGLGYDGFIRTRREKMVFYGRAIDANELRMYLNGDYDIFEIVEQHDGTWLIGYIDHG